MAEQASLREIASALRRLVASSPVRVEEIEAWQADARQVYDRLASKFPDVSLPHGAWHYLADADLRAKDTNYRANQDRMMETIIGALERGVSPADREIAAPGIACGPPLLALLAGASLVLLAAASLLLYRACS